MINQLIESYPRVAYKTTCEIYENIYVGPHGAIFNEDWSFNYEASQAFLVWDSNLKARSHAEQGMNFNDRIQQIREQAQKQSIITLEGSAPYALCKHYYKGYPFGHWFETIGWLRHIQEHYIAIYSDYGGIVGTKQLPEHFKAIGAESVYVKENHTLFVNKLYPSILEDQVGFTTRNAINWLREKYFIYYKLSNTNQHNKLYLSRNFFTHPNPIWTRRVDNEEAEVWPYLESLGYFRLQGNESIEEMIRLFYSASEIVFPHGSMICYAIFCNNNPKILEFISEHRYKEDFIRLLEKVGVDNYRIIKSKADPITNNITIDMNILQEELKNEKLE